MAAGQGQRHYDAVILKVLGATRWRILTPYILEYAMLGLMAALLATLAGGIIAYGVVTQIMRGDWTFLPIPVAVTLVSATFMTILLGLTTTWHSLQQKSAPLLRNS
jgi:putative ABC transport system permease protein